MTKKIFSIIALLCMAVSGAWAQDEELLTTILNSSNKDFKSGSKTFDDKATVTFSAAVSNNGDTWGWYSYNGVTLSVTPAHAVTAAEKEAEAQAALTQLNAMQETLDQASNAYLKALTDYEAAIRKRDATQDRINELTDQIGEIQGRLGNRARDMYRHGSTTFLDLLLGASSFEEFTQSWDLLNRVNETDATLSAQSRALRA